MDLFTRCPDCDTVFRVTTRHLQASGGQVRCGRCHTVFDAFASLTAKPPGKDQDQSAPEELRQPAPVADSTATAGPVELSAPSETAATDSETAPTETQDEVPEWEVEPVKPSVPTETQLTETHHEAPGLEAEQAVESEDQVDSDPATNLYEWEFKPAPKLRRTGLWLSLSLFLFISGLVQVGTTFRGELMVNFPQVTPLYQRLCQRLSCEIGLPRLADRLNIDASDLQFVDPQRPNLVKLTALVRNRARVPVEYPAFELTLTNAQQQVVARRVFLPGDYLQDAAQTEAGLGGRQELAVSMFLDTGPLRAAGYRIYLFYPTRT